ncbi:probable ADP-ribosylation factor GTPase-activating protein AGD11 isoform X2 [Zingiber officinale]|uniref:probable ADP-ribosylation factor GTPase-activating protein AGD11 isoform X2 n=1 Tax=Zingiber officinale TaxID=94328 RepID=UPI001C4AABBE|nr:probable ADP-ribosylation factor GTPase-activating protein AGD11 isoform X2 [Zingiber officinale]
MMSAQQEFYDSCAPIGSLTPQKRLEIVMNQPGNRYCADCNCPDPKWVSLNLGVFICIKCSGVHRSLGVHISKILSAKLDDWTDEQVDFIIEAGGNATVNMRYEAFLPENIRKLRPDSSIEERSDFIRGTNLAIRDVVSSDPYVILSLGHQSMKTRVIKSNLNPIWNEKLMLSIPDPIPPLKLQVYDKDTFSTDDHMGEAQIDIQPLVAAAKAYENSGISESMQLGKWLASEDNTLVKDSIISLDQGRVKQEITLKLQNVERGELEIELECVPLSQ